MSSTRRLPVLVPVLVLFFGVVSLAMSSGSSPTERDGGAKARSYAAAPSDDSGRPSRPTNLVADSAGSGTISLSWSASTDDHGVRGYMVFRDGSNVGTAANTEYLDRGLAPGRYTYRVAATDRDGNVSEHSAPASATATR